MKNKIISWLAATLAIIVSAYLLPGVTVLSFFAAFVTALVLGIINAFIKPVLVILTLPLNVLTLGLFTFIINALLIMLTGIIVPGFEVASFWWALSFGLILSLVNFVLHSVTEE